MILLKPTLSPIYKSQFIAFQFKYMNGMIQVLNGVSGFYNVIRFPSRADLSADSRMCTTMILFSKEERS
jgi:hypothetical protein